MLPLVTRYRRADVPFGWRRPLGSEFHGLMTIASVVLVLDLFRSWLATGRLVFDALWTGLFLAAAALFAGCTVLKKTTSVFEARG